MQPPDLSLAELLALDIRTYGRLDAVARSAALVVVQDDLLAEDRVKLNIILGYVSAKTGQAQIAVHHYMSAFNVSRTGKLNAQLMVAAGVGAILALIAQKDYQRARHTRAMLEAAVDGNKSPTVIERVLLDQLLEQINWRLADVL